MHTYSKTDNVNFVKEFGKSWKTIENKFFLWILTASLGITFILIIILANRDYDIINKNLSNQITQKYLKTLFSEIRIDAPVEMRDSTTYYSDINLSTELSDTDSDIFDGEVSSEMAETGQPGGLDLSDLNFPEALVAVKDRRSTADYVRPIQPGVSKSVEIEESKPFDPWKTPVQRQGDIIVEPVEEIVRGSQFVKGWRNPNEITLVIQEKEQMIEHCFKREAKYFNDLNGYVIVRFIILHTGKIDPNSIKIIKSTLYNKQVENCIKKRIQTWREFQELDASMGSVAVVQKFIFN